MKALSIGGSRNIGYYASMRLMDAGATVTFLLRNPAVFDQDDAIQKYVAAGKARLVKGDALVRDDCQKAWEVAAQGTGDSDDIGVDILLFTVGGKPKLNLAKGFVIDPPNLVTRSLHNVLSTLPTSFTQTKIISISANGLSKSSHKALPLLLKPLFRYFLTVPHQDKLGTERIASYCAGLEWDEQDGEVGDDVMGANWKQDLPRESGLSGRIVVVRPALLTDGECVADKEQQKGYRVSDADLPGSWTISRRDVAHFLVEGVLKNWDEYKDKHISIAY